MSKWKAPHTKLRALAIGSRLGLPVVVGKTAVFLACDDSSYINGTTVVLDGGTMTV
jgi:NAD(P)-dependent dehydrogenase (short-subunit alcohol dehydrogenase family)